MHNFNTLLSFTKKGMASLFLGNNCFNHDFCIFSKFYFVKLRKDTEIMVSRRETIVTLWVTMVVIVLLPLRDTPFGRKTKEAQLWNNKKFLMIYL